MAELQRLSPALWGLAENARLGGDHEASVRWAEAGRAASMEVGDAAYLYPFLVTGVRAHLGRGDPRRAEAWVDELSAAVLHRSIPGTLPAIDHARGLIALAHGSTGRARSLLESARAGWQLRRRYWEGAWAGLDLATCHARSNRPADARASAETVLAAALEVQSMPLQAAARALLARLRARSAPDDPWAPLTAREFEVARLIAEGHTNAEIAAALSLAPKTVSSHVEHILAKLGATRRAEVAAWTARLPSASSRHGPVTDLGRD
jgi:DNA-binding CsgD family transcriptional regulator